MSKLLGQSDVDTVREATDLVRLIGEHVPLRPKGREHVGLCPFHDDHTPSFAVVTHKGNAFYKCHSCGAGGDAFDFVMNYHKMEFGEALRFLADRAGITLKPRHEQADGQSSGPSRADLRKANAFAATFFQRTLNDDTAGAVTREIIQQRRIRDEMVKGFGLGAAPNQWDGLAKLIERRGLPLEAFTAAGLIKPRRNEPGYFDMFRNRLIFPICDELGNPVAFGARKIDPEDEPKYLNSAESAVFIKSRTLYGLHLAKRAIIDSKQAIITEGYTDVIACHQAGLCNVVGTLGTALTREHARILSRLCDTVILLFDGDEAGMRAADRGVNVFFTEPVDVKICVLPDQFDPDELLKENGGAERFQAAITKSVDALEYKVQRFRAQLDSASGISGRQKLLEQLLADLVDLGFASMQGVRKSLVMTRLAELLGMTLSDLERAIPRDRKRVDTPASVVVNEPSIPDEADSTNSEDLPAVSRARHLAEREVLAVLLFDPAAGLQPITLETGGTAPAANLLEVDTFGDSCCRAIARIVLQNLQAGQTFTVQQILRETQENDHRQMASLLYFDGERRCADHAENALAALASAVEALLSCIQRETFDQSANQAMQSRSAGSSSIESFQQFLNQRRQTLHRPHAIAQGVRS